LKRLLLVAVFFALFSYGTLAVIQQDSMKIFAVTTEGTGLSADLAVTTEPGTGRVWSSVTPLVGTTTQSAERTAIEAAIIYVPEAKQFDYKFDIKSDASVVEGPSAGAAMTLLVVSMLRNRHVPTNVSVTGTISSDGSIGPVGGVFEKAQEAGNQGIKLFLVPKGESKQIVKLPSGVESIDLISYALDKWGVKIVEVENMDQLLKLAYSDIGAIDVNKNRDENTFDFLPEPISTAQSLSLMYAITEKYVTDGKKQVEESKKALNGSMLEDNELVQVLLGSLNNSEETLNEAELLLDRNFLYSAANYAFLAKVNAKLVQDIAENPSILSYSSTLFNSRLQDLKKRIQSLESSLSETVPLDYLEWHIGAQQRVVYAENSVNKLLSSQTIVIDTTGGKTDYSQIIQRIQDYEFAEAWLEIAQDFANEAAKSERVVKPDNTFKSTVDQLLVQAENGLAVMKKEESEDIQRRYDAAVREKQLGWNLAAVFDAATAIALINSVNFTKDNDLNKLYDTLVEKSQKTKSEISSGKGAFVWANLYLDHANYYLTGADYYKSSKREAKALEAVKSGLSIAFMAENLSTASKDFYAYYDSIPEEKIIKTPANGKNNGKQNNTALWVLGIGFAAGWLLVGFLLLVVFKKGPKQKATMQQQMEQITKMQKELDKSLSEGKISNEQYYALQEKYSVRQSLLQKELEEKSERVVEIDSLRARLLGFEHVLHSLKSHYQAGLIIAEDYKKQVDIVQKEIDSIKAEIKSEAEALSKEDAQIKQQSIADLKAETEKIEKPKEDKKQKQKKAMGKKTK